MRIRLPRVGDRRALAVRCAAAGIAAVLSSLGTACAGAAAGTPVGEDFLTTTAFGVEAEVQPAELTRHPRGFYFREVMLGAGTEALGGRTVRVSYVVRLADGREVDRVEPEAPITFRVGEAEIIAALDAAVRGMRVGGTRQLVVPPRLGYGARGRGPVPPNAILVMMVRLESVQ